MKDPAKRLSLKEVLEHPWITKDVKGIREARRNSMPGNAFTLFSLAQPDRAGELLKGAAELHNKGRVKY